MAALHAALLVCDLSPSSVILASCDLYGATFALISKIFGPFGVVAQQADFSDLTELREKAAELEPQVLLAETISNPLLKVLDVAAVAEIAHSVSARLVVDGTFPHRTRRGRSNSEPTSSSTVRPNISAATATRQAARYLA